MKKLYVIILLIALYSITNHVNSQNLSWAKQFTGNASGASIKTDASADVYTTGSFHGTVDFDPGIGTYNMTSTTAYNSSDVFISKLDKTGNFLWAKQIGGSTSSAASASMAIDSKKNVYTTGYFNGTVDFDPGAGIYNLGLQNKSAIFISKLDSNGNFIWAKQIKITGQSLSVTSMTVDNNNDVFIAGYFQSYTDDFDPGVGTFTMDSNNGDCFIVKLDASGNFIWAKQFGSGIGSGCFDIKIDAGGNIYTSGTFYTFPTVFADFDPGPGTYYLTPTYGPTYYNGSRAAFISKLDASGNFVWAKELDGYSESINSIAIDNSGNVYTTGIFTFDADFDPGPATYNLTTPDYNNYYCFVCKLNSSGGFVWAKPFGSMGIGSYPGRTSSIAVDANQNVYTTGYFPGTADFDPSSSVFNLTSAGSNDIFLLKLDISGNMVCAKQIGGTASDGANSIAIDANSSNVYATGYFSGTVDFDPDTSVYNLTIGGGFVVKLSYDFQIDFYHQISNNSSFSSPKLIESGRINQSNARPFKLCADGSQSSFIEYHNTDVTQPTSNIYFQIKNSTNANLHGQFLTPTTVGTNIRKAVFNHPNYYNSLAFFTEDTIQITNGVNGNIIGEYPLQIYRAPVLLVHGLWSNKHTFDAMYQYLLANKYYSFNCYAVDYSENNARDFFSNRYEIETNINRIIRMCADAKVSSGKVDIVAHSMGGILARLYLQSSYAADNSPYRGDIHKLITLNGPHSGSQMANFLLSPSASAPRFFLNHLGRRTDLGAVTDLNVNSSAIDNVLNGASLNANKVPSTTITTTSANLGCSYISAFVTTSENVSIFNGNTNDLIVQSSSQSAGINLNTSVNNTCHINSTPNSNVIGLVSNLLDQDPLNTNYFTTAGFRPPNLTSTIPTTTSSGTIRITNLSSGQLFNAGSTIQVIVSGSGISNISFVGGNQDVDFTAQNIPASSGTFQYVIPQSAIGELKIGVLGGNSNSFYCVDTLTLNVGVSAGLDSISVHPTSIFMKAGEYSSVDITGYFDDGKSRILNNFPGVSYSIADTSVVLHDSLNSIRARSAGTTLLQVSYLGKTKTISIIVEPGDIKWLGTQSNNWTNGNNWSRGFVPDSYSVVTIPASTPFSPFIPASTNVSVGSISVLPGATLTVGSNANLKVTH